MLRNEATVRALYEALDRKDGDAMAACYAPDATFRDPVFPDLKGPEVGGMWRMLCSGATDLRVVLEHVVADSDAASARVVATYTFSRSGRKVRNVIDAQFAMKDGTILRQVDSFPFWRWSRQALGPTGLLLGWTPLVRGKVRADAGRRLQRYMAENPAKPPSRTKPKAPKAR
jgi:ketosteroid isomerase-like protein